MEAVKKETNSTHVENDVSNRHMTWWRNAWWIRVDSGPHLRTARGRRRTWRAARRAAEEARNGDRVEETQSLAEEAEGEKWGKEKNMRLARPCSESTLHLVILLPDTGNATASTRATAIPATAAAAAATAAMREQ